MYDEYNMQEKLATLWRWMMDTQSVNWNMYEMEYKGNEVKSNLSLIPLEDEYYEQYKTLIDTCYYNMRKDLNIHPYEKHSYSLEEPEVLMRNTFLFIDDDKIVGAVTCNKNLIENVAVSPKYQKQGYGRELALFAISHMQTRGNEPIKLTVTKWNENAITLYISLGFEITKELIVKGVNKKDDNGNWAFEFIDAKDLNIR
ncbi:MAG: GNAT family N-acetyltransferase [Defluviitaleaceae bacterium]|nr:GNAT family N-acetyltransferase [Defluviitaleaceae bacterium]